MNNKQLDAALRFVKLYGGSYARNALPKPKKFPIAFIANTDQRGGLGEHWVAIYFTSAGACEYFDPLGFPPVHKDLLSFINRHNKAKKFVYNCQAVQHASTQLCGKFCIAFVKARAKGVSFKCFLNRFSLSLIKNGKRLPK